MSRSPRPSLWYFTAAASILVGVVPVILLERWWGVPRKITVGFGVLAWVAGVLLIKVPLHHLIIEPMVRRGSDHARVSILHGALSGCSELGAAALFFIFVLPRLTLPQLLGFGAGAGMVEAIMLPFIRNPLEGTVLERHAAETIERSSENAVVQWLSVLERVWATLLQVSSRALVYFSVVSGNPVPAVLALSGFAACDGLAYYAHLEKWPFDRASILVRIHMYLAGVAALLWGALGIIYALLPEAV